VAHDLAETESSRGPRRLHGACPPKEDGPAVLMQVRSPGCLTAERPGGGCGEPAVQRSIWWSRAYYAAPRACCWAARPLDANYWRQGRSESFGHIEGSHWLR